MADLLIKISGDSVSVERALEKTNTALGKTKKVTESTALTFKEFKSSALIAVAAIGTAVAITGKFIKTASDAEETINKFGVVFKDVGIESEKVADNLAKNFGLASVTAKKLLGDTGDLLTGFGFTGAAALNLSKQVNELAVDLASFTNYQGGTEGASKALVKALVGETEQVKALGIVIRQQSPEFINLVKHYQDAEGATLLQAKAIAVLKIAQQQSKNAIGDYARTQGAAANQMRLFGERTKDVMISLGGLLLPTFTKVVTSINDMLIKFKNIGEEIIKFKDSVAGIRTLASIAFLFGIGWDFVKQTFLIMVTSMINGVKVLMEVFQGLGTIIKGVFTGTLSESLEAAKQNIMNAMVIMKDGMTGNFVSMGERIKQFYNDWNNADEESKARLATSNKGLETDNNTTATNVEITWRDKIKQIGKYFKENSKAMISEGMNFLKNLSSFASSLVEVEKNKYDAIDEADTEAREAQKQRVIKAAKAEKALAITQTIIETIVSAQRAFSSLAKIPFIGPILGAAAAIAATIAGMARVASIRSQPLPTFAQGGDFVTNGPQDITVGDNPSGRERVTITPEEGMGNDSGMVFHITNLTVKADSPEQFGNAMREFAIRTARR